jgi:CheY-like chemotaxis protein
MTRVLVADDSTHLRRLIAQVLTAEGHCVVEAADGRRALDLLTSEPIRVAVLDVMMPGIDGLTLCSRLRTMPATSQVRVVIVSAAATEADALAAGADAFLDKPFRLATLRSVVQSLAAVQDIVPLAAHDAQRVSEG